MDAKFNALLPPAEDVEKHKSSTVAVAKTRYFGEALRIGEEEARDALLREAKKHRYWREAAAKRMQIENLEHSSCLQYILESFTEARSTMDAHEAYTLGQFIGSGGLEPGASAMSTYNNPWDYEILPLNEFVDQVRVLEMPGTSKLNPCKGCNAEGCMHCFHCRGYGTDKCNFCRGTGMKSGVAHPAVYTHPMIATFPHADLSRGYASSSTAMVRQSTGDAYGVGTPMHFMSKTGVPPPGLGTHDLCYFCHGRGIRECYQCKGTGKKPCSACNGSGSTRNFIKLKVFFKVERSEFFTECCIPAKLISRATGADTFSEEQPYVLPITKHPVKEINEVSRQFCASHLQQCMGVSRVIKQRQQLIEIPIVKVSFSLGKSRGVYWVYGNERLVYVPKYPSKCAIL